MTRLTMYAGLVVGGLLLATQTIAGGHGHQDYDEDGYFAYAKVVRAEPIIRTVTVSTPRRECWDEEVRHLRHHGRRGPRSYTPMVVGGIVGGVVGNQFGHGRGRNALTVAGALLGASIGRDVARPHHRGHRIHTTTERHCEIRDEYHEEERVEGYRVTYRYKGQSFVTRTDHHPGKRIRIKVHVEPVGYNTPVAMSEGRYRNPRGD